MTADQLRIDGTPAPAAPPKLTDRQQAVYDLLQQRAHDGATADEVGAHLHQQAGKHPADSPCMWDGQNGRQVLQALHRKGLVRQLRDRTGRWTLRDVPAAEPEPGDRYNVFPPGY